MWRNGSLGAPEPGMRYTMAPVPGYGIVLERAGQELRYHTSGSTVKFVRLEPYLDDDLGFQLSGNRPPGTRPNGYPAHAMACYRLFHAREIFERSGPRRPSPRPTSSSVARSP
jgi:hypothetical protein